ncbi:esterase [Rhodoferax lacus]|uniref:Esterase n=1 Tax=Rhodoferax lacus TaxID=2184758 RepID=A0A3E1RDG3_9BURK|nr:alpha/beta hydrolase [Rhodoferax lacus]RFO97414.1 esterase [Rhodoferax lacus]
MRPLYREFSVQSEIDAQYNPSIDLPDPNAPGRHFVETAERARATLPCVLDVPYGPTLEETLDIFPAAQANAPVFVFIHGGYWRALSSKTFSGVALGLQACGITTVVINYALCPYVTIDEIVRQTRSALAWTLRNIQTYGGDPARVALGGHSAGGHLTAMALQTPWAQDYGLPQDPFVAAIPFSGLFDLEPLRYSYLQPAIQLDDGTIRRNSPAFGVRACKTPLWITWGGAETTEFARQSSIYHQAWLAAGNHAELRDVPGANHFTVIAGLEDSKSNVCRWLADKLQA